MTDVFETSDDINNSLATLKKQLSTRFPFHKFKYSLDNKKLTISIISISEESREQAFSVVRNNIKWIGNKYAPIFNIVVKNNNSENIQCTL